jgi:hypothetical protein
MPLPVEESSSSDKAKSTLLNCNDCKIISLSYRLTVESTPYIRVDDKLPFVLDLVEHGYNAILAHN